VSLVKARFTDTQAYLLSVLVFNFWPPDKKPMHLSDVSMYMVTSAISSDPCNVTAA